MDKRFFVSFAKVAAGLVFIVSGLAKSFDSDYFGNIMISYGSDMLYGVAPFIVFLELVVGLALIFNIYPVYAACAGIVLIATFSLIYLYGLLFAGITSCGCFGRISFLDASPVSVFIRNGILSVTLAAVALADTSAKTRHVSLSVFAVAVCFMSVCAFICGNTFVGKTISFHARRNVFKPTSLSEHILHEFVHADKDSTYMVTAFSYTCPHCLNSIGNMEQYERFGIVDRVIGLCVENEAEEAKFKKVFRPLFCIENHPLDEIMKISQELPVSYFIRNDSVVGVVSGEIPSAYFFVHE